MKLFILSKRQYAAKFNLVFLINSHAFYLNELGIDTSSLEKGKLKLIKIN
jgi:hypothetical protein